ncbi:hypothetical protein BC629DRAFT_218103 [Irpex lacteus]|nr:hypothetical protein BC629DRAFT_218103 [Irpex lacteus]
MRRDGAIWFVVLFLMRFLNFVFFLTLSLDHNLMAFILIWALISVAVSRMILHIETLKRPLVDVTSRNVPTVTRMPAQEMIVLVRADRITDTCSSNTGH